MSGTTTSPTGSSGTTSSTGTNPPAVGPSPTPAAAAAASFPLVDPSVVNSLVQILQSPTTAQGQVQQQLLLQRLLLTGDIVPARVPPPLNITQVGGYLNYLASQSQKTLLEEMLAAALGVAPPLSLLQLPPGPPLVMVTEPNDQPTVASLAMLVPLTFQVRSDFAPALMNQIAALHPASILPLYAPPVLLPAATPGATAPTDWLPYIGREMQVMPTLALNNPATDPIVLASANGSPPFTLYAASSTAPVPSPALQAVAWNAGQLQAAPLTQGVVNLDTLLNQAGWYRKNPTTAPTSPSDTSWAVLLNLTGLLPGVTLGSELGLLYPSSQLNGSVALPYVANTWNGTSFVTPTPSP